MMEAEEDKRLEEALEWLYSTQMFGIKLGLENTEKLLAEFLAYPSFETKVVQVAGTNGKGSTAAFMQSISRAQVIKTGLFTSPHLVRFSERMRVNGEEIPAHILVRLLEEVRALVSEWSPHPTFFEISLAVALKYFKEEECELIILETGMGGRLDATTAVPKDVAVITPIGMDHQQYLGETLGEIAGEKAGIMQEGKPCVSAPQHPEAEKVLEIKANKIRCGLRIIEEPLNGYYIGLRGEHQRWNAALAVAALEELEIPLRYESVSEGVGRVEWPGRFQRIREDGRELILDCCHNVPAAEKLVKVWEEVYPGKKAHLVFGAAKDKNIMGVLKLLLPLCASVEVYGLDNARGETVEILTAIIKELNPDIPCSNLSDLGNIKEASHTLVTGSLFLVGEWIEKNRALL